MKHLIVFFIVYAGFLVFPALFCAGLYLLQTRVIEPSASPVKRWLATLAYATAMIALWWAGGRPEAGGDGAAPSSLSRMFVYSSFIVLPIAAAAGAVSLVGVVVFLVRPRRIRWMMAAVAAGGLAYVIFFPHPYSPMNRPADGSFQGRWVLDPASVPSVRKRAGRNPIGSQMEFRPDGRLAVKDMPYEENIALRPDASLLTGAGTWELELHQDWVMTFSLHGRGGTLFIELEDGKPAALTYGVGDPDSSERWIWRRAL